MEDAVFQGDVKKLAELIRQDPGFKVNMDHGAGVTFLHHACDEGENSSPVIPLLLAHPDIDVNVKSTGGQTPFYYPCLRGSTSSAREMLKDSRVNVNKPRNDGITPLWRAACNGYLDIIGWWIVSGREVDLGKPGDVDYTDAIGVAKIQGETEVVALLERFQNDATKTRQAVRVEVGWYDELAAGMFALVVFVSDGLLKIKDTPPSPAARYFKMARRLPLELQMLLCFRQVGSTKEIIPGKESEAAFKSLARTL